MNNGYNNKIKSRLLIIGIFLLNFLVLLGIAAITVALINVLTNKLELDAYSITFFILTAFGVVIALGTAITFVVMARKTQVLVDSLSRVAEGDFSAQIEFRRSDPFYKVYSNFNRMTDELRAVSSLREDFVRNFSHEIKTPLFSIHGFANLLLEGGLSDEEQKKLLQIISDETGRLFRLADSTLILSKLENQQLLSESKVLKLDSEINDCIIMLEREWDGKSLQISADLEPVKIRGDRSLMKHVWLNLLSNAIKFTPVCGKINVTLRKEGNTAVAVITDSGCGIQEEELPHIFDKYYRAPSAKNSEGNGLGLAICKRICELAGGSIVVESTVGKGSAFTVTLPL